LAWTQREVEREAFERSAQSFREISSIESDIGKKLFILMDEQITQDDKVTAAEYFNLLSSADSNNDKLVSTEEVHSFLASNLLGPSSNAELMFGETDLTNVLSLTVRFKMLDTN
ncbi:hypothetical protein ACJMK2_034824, partial [Sinanodonta woodiana]